MIGVVNGLAEWLFAFPGPHLGDDQRRRPAARIPREELAARDLARVAALHDLAAPIAGLANREGTARHLRRDAGAGRQAARCAHALAQSRAGRRLDQTGLPATIEGAIRSGYRAALAIIVERRALAP